MVASFRFIEPYKSTSLVHELMPDAKTTSRISMIRRLAHHLLFLSCVTVVSGCAMGGFNIDNAVPDRSIVTGSIGKTDSAKDEKTDTHTLSDQSTIKNVVSALNFEQWTGKTVPWANPDTGSQGIITTMNEHKSGGVLCRKFETSRQSFNGASLYQGEACMKTGGDWFITSFSEV